MTRRERLERKLDKRREWSGKAKGRSKAASARAHDIASGIPPGQPILVGHHSERHHRRDIDRMDTAMRTSIAQGELAAHHAGKADGIEDQLDRSIFSDDADAVEQLQARIKVLEDSRDRIKRYNATCRAAARRGEKLGDTAILDGTEKRQLLSCANAGQTGPGGAFPGYVLSLLGKRIRDAAERMKVVQQRQARASEAEQSPHGVVIQQLGGNDVAFVRVTFAERPERSILDALKAAGFWWKNGCWTGERSKLPASVSDLENHHAE